MNFRERLAEPRLILWDGGMGTMLFAAGLENGIAPERWLFERPEAIEAVHRGYAAAGCEVIQTNTFGGNRIKLEENDLGERLREVQATAAELARRGAGPGRFVAGDIGPSGQFIAPMGPYSEADMEALYAEQAEALAAAGVDLISIETMYSLAEAGAALRGARRTGLPVAICLTFNLNPRGYYTLMGENVATVVEAMLEQGADLVGANCTLGSSDFVQLAKELVAAAAGRIPVLVQPNAGEPELVDAHAVYRKDPAEFAAELAQMAAAGCRAVGGCCGTTPDFLAKVAERLRALGEA
ncbi:MAG TPA: homocysteine S-methyltransferase family protein [Acidobacteriota bacterium]